MTMARSLGRRVGLTIAALMPLTCACGRHNLHAEIEEPCSSHGTSLVVLLEDHSLLLCSNNKAEKEYAVSLGKGGVGKKRVGDNRTPVGTYDLGMPRASKRFGTFIPVGYPTDEQKRQGYTGQAIGIHGPARGFTWAGWLNTAFDYTEGCVLVGSDEAIGEIADWVKQKRPKLIHLVDDS